MMLRLLYSLHTPLFTAYLDSIPHNALGLILDYPGKIRLPRDVLFIPSLYLISGNYKVI